MGPRSRGMFNPVIAAILLALFSPQASAQSNVYCGPADIAFVVDNSTYMNATIVDLKNTLVGVASQILAQIEQSCDPETGAGSSYRLALVTFTDTLTVHVNFSLQNRSEFESAVSLLTTSAAGAGIASASDEALNTVINVLPASARPAGKQTGDFSKPWRDTEFGTVQMRKFIILLTDSPPGGFDGDFNVPTDPNNAHQLALQAQAKGIKILAIWPPSAPSGGDAIGIMQDYADVTGGYFTRLDEPSPPFPAGLTFPSTIILRYLSDPDPLFNNSCVPVNRPPRASCVGWDVEVPAGPGCAPAQASIEDSSWPSWDWEDGDVPPTTTQIPASPYFPGTTRVTLRATDSAGAFDDCRANVVVTYAHCTPPPPVLKSLTASPLTSAKFGTAVTWTATATGGIWPLQYEFWRYCYASPGWKKVQDYSALNTYTWAPAASDVGMCYVHARVRSAGLTVPYEGYIDGAGFQVLCDNSPRLTSVTPSAASPVQAPTTITWTANAVGGTEPLEYEFWRYSYTTRVWTRVQPYSTSRTYTWSPGLADAGQYALHVRVRCSSAWHAPAPFEHYLDTSPFTITTSVPARITNVLVSPASPQPYNTSITWTPQGTGGSGTLLYEFWRYCTANPGWNKVQNYAVASSYTWAPTAADVGACYIHVRVKSAASTLPYEGYFDAPGFLITRPIPVKLTAFTATPALPVQYGTPITWTATSSGTAAPEYQFWRYSKASGLWTVARDYSTANTYVWTPALQDAGVYAMHVRVRTVGATTPYEGYLDYSSQFAITSTPPARVSSLGASAATPQRVNATIRWTAAATAADAGTLEYEFWSYHSGSNTWTMLRAYAAEAFVDWMPSLAGTYRIQVNVRHAGSSLSFEDFRRSTDYVINP